MDPLTTVTRARGPDRPCPIRRGPGWRATSGCRFCRTRQRHILQLPETVVVLHGSGAEILELCDGRRTVADIVAELGTPVPDRSPTTRCGGS